MPAIDDLAEIQHSSPKRHRSAVAALLLGLLWLVIAAAAVAIGSDVHGWANQPNPDTGHVLKLIAMLSLHIAPPIAVVTLALAAVRRTRPEETQSLLMLEARQARAHAAGEALHANVDAVDRTLAGISNRLAALQAAVANDAHGLIATAERLQGATAMINEAALTADGAAARLQTATERSHHQAEAITVLLDHNGIETGRQLETVETMLAAVWSRNADAAAQADHASTTMQALLSGLEATAARAAATFAEHAAALHGEADAAFNRTAAALAATRDGVAAQTAALAAGVDHARTALDDFGGEAARVIGKRLDRLNEAAELLGQRLTEQDVRSRTLVDTVERSFAVLDTRLNHAANNSYGALDGIAGRMAVVGNQVQTLNAPLRQTHDLSVETEAAIARLHASAGAATDTLAQTLPTQRAAVTQLGEALQGLHDAALQLSGPVEHGRSVIAAAAGDLVTRRNHLEAGAATLVERCEAARAVLASIEAQAEGSALAAASQLIEVLGRVREIAAASAGQMRETLTGVVGEAQAALAHAGTTTAATAFGEPIRGQLAAVEAASQRAGEAAQAAAERVAQRLLGLTGTVAAVEARLDEVQTRHDLRTRDDLQTRSTRLLDALNAASIDIARLLQLDVGDASWKAYLKGDRSIFTRRVVRLADKATSRAIKRHYNHDAPFRELAVQFIDDFQRLLKYVDADRDGHALAVTLLSSDIGKLYVVLEQAIGRPG